MNIRPFFAPFSVLTMTVGAATLTGSYLVMPAAALAQQASQVLDSRSGQLSLAGIDLSTPDGLAAAHVRLEELAKRLCDRVADERDLGHHEHYLRCVDETVTAAVRQVQEAALVRAADKAPPVASR